MGVTVKVEIHEIRDGFCRAHGRDLTRPDEPPKPLSHFDVHQVRRMELIVVPEKAGFDANAERGLEQKLQHRGRVEDNHAESRSSRMTLAAGVFNVTRRRP